MTIVLTVLAVLLLFSLTIFVHELGHFLVARWCGMAVDTFSIGFGPTLWKRRVNGVTYRIGALPFGGYVALPQMEPGDERDKDAKKDDDGDAEKPDAEEDAPPPAPPLPSSQAWKKILVSVAGAVGNLILAVILAWVVYVIGKPSAPQERECTIGFVEKGSPAEAAGLRVGDRIVEAAGRPVANWIDLATHLTLSSKDLATVRVEGADRGNVREIEVETVKVPLLGTRTLRGAGWVSRCLVWRPIAGSSAAAAGIVGGDQIVSFDGVKLYSREQLSQLVTDRVGKDVPIVVRREGREVVMTVRPAFDAKENRGLIGIEWNLVGNLDYDTIAHPTPSRQLQDHAGGIFRFLKALVTPHEAKAAAEAVGGPVSILMMYWQMIRTSLMMAIWFTGFLNVNLAILNLLPIPVLDGGHIVFSTWEWLTRRPVPARVLGAIHRVFATLLIGLFLLLTYRDTLRWIVPSVRKPARVVPEAVTNAPAPAAAATNAAPATAP